MTDSPLGILCSVVLAAIVGCWWWRDFRAAKNAGAASSDALLLGATPCPIGFVAAAALGGALLTFLETGGELALGISGEQTNITALFLGAMLAGAVLEEVLFRGFLVVENRGRAWLWGSIAGTTLLFALGHDFLWQYNAVPEAPWWQFWQGVSLQFTRKGFFSFAVVLFAGLYFFAVRFHRRNPARSLLPCFAAHAVRNLTVFAVKLVQGHVVGLW